MRAKSLLPTPPPLRMPESRENPKVGGGEGREKGIRSRTVRAGWLEMGSRGRSSCLPPAPRSLPLSFYWASADQGQ